MQKIQIDEGPVELTAALTNGYVLGSAQIPAGMGNFTYEMVMKMGFSSNYVVFTPVQK